MRQLLSAITLLLILLSSCKKEYRCSCTVIKLGKQYESDIELIKSTNEMRALNKCKAEKNVYYMAYGDSAECKVKLN